MASLKLETTSADRRMANIWNPRLVPQKTSIPIYVDGREDIVALMHKANEQRREIVKAFDEWYGADISATLISRVTNAVIDKVCLNGNRDH